MIGYSAMVDVQVSAMQQKEEKLRKQIKDAQAERDQVGGWMQASCIQELMCHVLYAHACDVM